MATPSATTANDPYDQCSIVGAVPKSADAQPELSLQGSLFGEPEPAEAPRSTLHDAAGDLSNAELGADAAARPRQRHNSAKPAATGEGIHQEAASIEASEDDAPPWAHHSQLEPEQLTPVLRHYVELKRGHPERVLL